MSYTHGFINKEIIKARILSCYSNADELIKGNKSKEMKEEDETEEYQKLEDEGVVSDEDNKEKNKD
jgi:hypothetical protein